MVVVFWTGWGLAVVPLALLGGLIGVGIGVPVSEVMSLSQERSGYLWGALAALFAGALVYGFQRWRAEATSEMVFDEQTGKQFKLLGDPGTFMFIQMRYWAAFLLACAVLAGVSALFV